jgi:hypothetical protein
MKERDLDEFQSVFRSAIIPTIEVERIGIESVVVLADFGELTGACARVAERLAARFGAHITSVFLLHPEDAGEEEAARAVLADLSDGKREVRTGNPAEELEALIASENPSLVIAPEPFHVRSDAGERGFVDALLISTPLPTLLVRNPDVDSMFDQILAKIPGGRHELIEQFSIAFALCDAGGSVRLLHVLEENALADLVRILEVTPSIDTEHGQADLLAAAQTRMDHLLKGAIRTAEGADFAVVADLRVGDPFEIVPEAAGDCTLLILGSQSSHTEFLESRSYALMKASPGVHVLAL